MSPKAEGVRTARWLLLIHELPPAPAYLRVKVRRRLQTHGAHLLKNSVYLLPNSADALEDFHWLRREILAGGGEATVIVADLVEGTSDMELEDGFRDASDAEYAAFTRAARKSEPTPADRDATGLRAQLREIVARDFFEAAGRGEAERTLRAILDERSRAVEPRTAMRKVPAKPVGATWVTRRGVFVDRIASAWLIRRFIDPAAHFKFVAATGYKPRAGELRFDMFEGEFTHDGARCTFETLVAHFDLARPGVDAIAEIVHDIDLKVGHVRREETEGVRLLIRGICLARERDAERVEAAHAVFDGLLAHFTQ